MPQTRVNFIPEQNVRINALTGYQDGDYGAREARQALANADAGGGGGGGGTPPADIAAGIDLSTDIDTIIAALGATATAFVEFNGTANDTSAVASAANPNSLELTIQNKDLTNFLYVRLGSAATTALSYTLPPLALITFDGILAQQSLNVITDTGLTADYFGMRTNA